MIKDANKFTAPPLFNMHTPSAGLFLIIIRGGTRRMNLIQGHVYLQPVNDNLGGNTPYRKSQIKIFFSTTAVPCLQKDLHWQISCEPHTDHTTFPIVNKTYYHRIHPMNELWNPSRCCPFLSMPPGNGAINSHTRITCRRLITC